MPESAVAPPGVWLGCGADPGTIFSLGDNSSTNPLYTSWTSGQRVLLAWAGSRSLDELFALHLVPVDRGYGYGDPLTIFDELRPKSGAATYDVVCSIAQGRDVAFSIPYELEVPRQSASGEAWYRLHMTAVFEGVNGSSISSTSGLIRLGEVNAQPLLSDTEVFSRKLAGGSLVGVAIFAALFTITNAILLSLASQSMFLRLRSTTRGMRSRLEPLAKPRAQSEARAGYIKVDRHDSNAYETGSEVQLDEL